MYICFPFSCFGRGLDIKLDVYITFLYLLQVVALNSSQAAEGELYVDDGKSFEFKQGAYIHRRFVFSGGKLTSFDAAAIASSSTKFSSNCVIERIILLGHSGAKSALVEPENRKVEIELGPLHFQTGRHVSVLTIRKPNLLITDDWTVKIL